jgi:hypothetical protein
VPDPPELFRVDLPGFPIGELLSPPAKDLLDPAITLAFESSTERDGLDVGVRRPLHGVLVTPVRCLPGPADHLEIGIRHESSIA